MTFDPQPVLEGELVTLRPLHAKDHDALRDVAADPAIWAQHPAKERATPEGFRAFFDESLATGGALVVIERATGQVIGSSRYFGLDEAASEVEIGWTFLAPRFWGGRYNGEVKRLMLAHAFRFVRHVVFLVDPHNIRSQRAVIRIGGVLSESRPDRRGGTSLAFRIDAPAGSGPDAD